MNLDEFKEKSGLSNWDNVIQSDSWDVGGTVGTCWGTKTITPEDPPEMFDELESILDSINPEIDHYEKCSILQSVASTEIDIEKDWYGGKRVYSYYEITINDLFDELKRRELLPTDENEKEDID